MIGRSIILRVSGIAAVERTVKRSRLFTSLVRRFIAGEADADAVSIAEGLIASGFLTSLDLLGENTSSRAEAEEAVGLYIRVLNAIAKSPSFRPAGSDATTKAAENMNLSIKLTQCGLNLDVNFASDNLKQVVRQAGSIGSFIRVDMEGSSYTEQTLKLVEDCHSSRAEVGTVVQSYLYRTKDDVKRLMQSGIRVRLVKGAYLEAADVAHQKKAEVDRAYLELAKHLLCNGNYPAIATHDERIINAVLDFCREKEIDVRSFEFQMLYGIRRDLQDSLKSRGYNVRIYIPYGTHWYPYFARRLAERPANAMFILRSILRP